MVYFENLTRKYSSNHYLHYSLDKILKVFFRYRVKNRIYVYLEVPFDNKGFNLFIKRFIEVDIFQMKNEWLGLYSDEGAQT